MKTIVITAFLLCAFAQTGCAQNKAKADSSQQIADRIVESKIPVLVDFWAGWCMPCKILDPILEEVEKEYKGRVLFMRVNVDAHLGLVQYFQVQAVPTVFIIEDKTVRTALPGVRDKAAYKNALDSALKLAEERKSSPDK